MSLAVGRGTNRLSFCSPVPRRPAITREPASPCHSPRSSRPASAGPSTSTRKCRRCDIHREIRAAQVLDLAKVEVGGVKAMQLLPAALYLPHFKTWCREQDSNLHGLAPSGF